MPISRFSEGCVMMWDYFSPQSGHGANRLLLNKQKVPFISVEYDFGTFHTLSIYTHKTGLDSVALKVCKKNVFTLLVFGVNMTPH